MTETSIRRTVGEGQVWPPEAVAAEPSTDATVIYDPDNHSAWIESKSTVALEDER